MAQQHPDTFEVADIDHLREVVQPGVFAKVVIENERIWTTVTDVDGVKVKATLANDPFGFDGEHGDEVQYELRHIYNVMNEGEYVA
jgi:hypothetical protein